MKRKKIERGSWITKKGRRRHPEAKALPEKAPSFTGYGMRVAADGSVVVPRGVDTKQGHKWTKAKVPEGLSAAIRMQRHIYESELAEGSKVLHSIRTTIDLANEILRLKNSMTAGQRDTIRKMIADLYAEYGRPTLRNPEKVRAGEMFGKALRLFREGNWSAALPALNAAVESLMFRHEDTLGIRKRTRRKGVRMKERLTADQKRDKAVIDSIEGISSRMNRGVSVSELWKINKELTSTANRLARALGSGRKKAQRIMGSQIARVNEARDLRLPKKEKDAVEALNGFARKLNERMKNTDITSFAGEVARHINQNYSRGTTVSDREIRKAFGIVVRELNGLTGLHGKERWDSMRAIRTELRDIKWLTPTLKKKAGIVEGVKRELARARIEMLDPYGRKKAEKAGKKRGK